MNYTVSLNQIKDYNTRQKPLNTQHAALLVIEMQETFRSDMGLISDKQINQVKELINFATDKAIKTIFVRHNDSSDSSTNMINWWGDKLEHGSSGWEIIPEIKTEGHLIIDKTQYSSFYKTNLEQILKLEGITDIIICGLMTNCCCETAARDAFMRGFNVFFVNDATATINEELHLASIKNIAFGFGTVVDTKELTNQ